MNNRGWYLIEEDTEGRRALFDDRRLPIEAPKEAKLSLGYWDGAEWYGLPDRHVPQEHSALARKEP